jgi:hypothetical protein
MSFAFSTEGQHHDTESERPPRGYYASRPKKTGQEIVGRRLEVVEGLVALAAPVYRDVFVPQWVWRHLIVRMA